MVCSVPEVFSGITTAIFDFDGTLFNLDIDWDNLRAVLRRTLMDEFGIQRSFENLVEDVESLRELDDPRIFRRIISIVDEMESTGVHTPRERAIAGARCLRSSGMKMAILTLNTHNAVHGVLEEYNLRDLFDVIVTFEDVIRHKPDPEGVHVILNRLNSRAEETILIGDSSRDLMAAKNSGVRFMHVSNFESLWHGD